MTELSTVLVVFVLSYFCIGVNASVDDVAEASEVEKITKILQDFESKFIAIEKKITKMEQKYAYKENLLRRRVDSLEKQNKLLQDNFLRCRNKDLFVRRSSDISMNSAAEGRTAQESQPEVERPILPLRKNTIQDQAQQARRTKDLQNNKRERIHKQDIRRDDEYSKKTQVQQELLESLIPMITKTPVLIPRQTAQQYRVAFYATVTPDVHHLGANQIIVFDNVRTNIGNVYHREIGVFIAPVTGTYFFAATLSGRRDVPWVDLPDNHFYAHIDVEGKAVASFVFYPRWLGQVSQSVIVHLHEGEVVSVKNDLMEDGIMGGTFTSFTGFLLYEQ